MSSTIRFTAFPRTAPPPQFVLEVVDVFRSVEAAISTNSLAKGLKSDPVLKSVAAGLRSLGFAVEASKRADDKIPRPVFYGENGKPTLTFEVDAYHDVHRCGLEIEAGRATASNAIYRDLIQAMMMVHVDHLVLAVPNSYRYVSGGKTTTNRDYDATVSVANALYSHDRVKLPYGLTVLGY